MFLFLQLDLPLNVLINHQPRKLALRHCLWYKYTLQHVMITSTFVINLIQTKFLHSTLYLHLLIERIRTRVKPSWFNNNKTHLLICFKVVKNDDLSKQGKNSCEDSDYKNNTVKHDLHVNRFIACISTLHMIFLITRSSKGE